jgi:8-oxo-dGTP pyrophosphatase MutT (NUDIX family)
VDQPAVNSAATRRLISCGGVLFRYPYGGGLEFLLVGRQNPPLWALPKGTPHDGETIEQTALREIEEETGVLGQIVAPLGSITYTFRTPPRGVVLPWRAARSQDRRGETAAPNTRIHKTVHHFLLRPVAGDTALHDAEYDFARWLPAADALSVVSHENERAVLRRALSLLGHGGGQPGSPERKAGAESSRSPRRRRRT